MPTFGERFKQLRNERGLKQEELINEFNKKFHFSFTKSAISQYENGKRIPEIQALSAFSDFFNVSVDYLLGKSNERTKGINENTISFNTRDKAKEILEVIKNAGIDLNNIDYEKLEQLLKLANIEKQE